MIAGIQTCIEVAVTIDKNSPVSAFREIALGGAVNQCRTDWDFRYDGIAATGHIAHVYAYNPPAICICTAYCVETLVFGTVGNIENSFGEDIVADIVNGDLRVAVGINVTDIRDSDLIEAALKVPQVALTVKIADVGGISGPFADAIRTAGGIYRDDVCRTDNVAERIDTGVTRDAVQHVGFNIKTYAVNKNPKVFIGILIALAFDIEDLKL